MEAWLTKQEARFATWPVAGRAALVLAVTGALPLLVYALAR